MKRMTPTLAICCAAVLAAVVAAVADAGGDPTPAGVYGTRPTVSIENFTFTAALVAPGAEVTVRNLDGVGHTVTSDTEGVFDSDVVNGKSEGSLTAPSEPGEYPYHCEIHTGMKGKLVVAGA